MMETRFIEGGEYVDRQAYIKTRDENSRLRERIAELEAERNGLQVELGRWMRIDAENQARLNALELKSALPWEEDWERGYVCGWNECRKAALEQKENG